REAATAQAPTERNAPAGTSRINLTLEQRNDIKEILKDLKMDHFSVETRFSIGDVMPPSQPLQPMPPEVATKVAQVKSHLICLLNDKVIIVHPKDNKIVDIIERSATQPRPHLAPAELIRRPATSSATRRPGSNGRHVRLHRIWQRRRHSIAFSQPWNAASPQSPATSQARKARLPTSRPKCSISLSTWTSN